MVDRKVQRTIPTRRVADENDVAGESCNVARTQPPGVVRSCPTPRPPSFGRREQSALHFPRPPLALRASGSGRNDAEKRTCLNEPWANERNFAETKISKHLAML